MHSSWFRSLSFRSLILPTAGITLSLSSNDSNNQQKRRSSPTMQTRKNDTSPLKHWSPSMLATTLVVADQFTDGERGNDSGVQSGRRIADGMETPPVNRSWTGCNPLSSCNATQIAPFSADEQDTTVKDENRNHILNASSASSQSLQQPDGTLSANVSSTQLEELVMKDGDDSRAPLVILFGWAGCRDRYLAKYSTYYQKEGYSVARFTAPIMKIRSFSSYRKFALEIYEKILENEPGRPIYFHVFSMNGCSLFTALWDLLDNVPDGTEIKKRVKGLVFDSAPANVLPWQAANAVSTAMLPRSSSVTREAYRVALAGIFSVHRALVWLQSNFNAKTYEKHFAFFRLQCFEDLPKNQLYLYSEADDICVRESIEEFQRTQRERQANIRHVCWNDSEHCQHYRRYEKEYIQHCLDFMRHSLKEPQVDA